MNTQPQIYYADGKTPVVLNAMELHSARYMEKQIKERFGNDLGFEIPITTLSTIMKKISEQKFYKIAPAKYLPVRVGEGAWSSNLVTYRSYSLADDFSSGVLNLGSNSARLAAGDAGVDSLTIQVLNWGKSIHWNIIELKEAAKSGNWDLVSAKEKARKQNWDLGIQKVAFVGIPGNSTCLGLLNQSGITVNTSFITAPLGSLSSDNLSVFIGGLLNLYRSNCNRAAWPNRFVIPESDFLSLATPSSNQFPIKSRLELMLETFVTMTGNSDFAILPLAYADAAYHADVASIAGQQVYALFNAEEESIRMDIPVDYTNTLANSLDNFMFQNVGYGQFTGVLAYRPLELMYFQYTAS